MIELYQKIKNIREDLDIKQYEFAKMLKLNPSTYTSYENGFRSIPIETLDKIAIKLNVSIDYLLDKTSEKRYDNSKKMDYHILLYNVKKYRILNKFTQQDLANKLNISQQVLSNYERGLRPIPINILNKLSDIYNISADILLGKVTVVKEKINV